ncbi:hypothetical protein RE628_17650 [Paenibacillus sp. D2_2]|uniref:hypothetical protein n=1 Tax=Paenibacillus sp. D2_2 TaxID=3073092 RepID=UPI002815E382|nr:hypothetical protein [Paenibacillus sp. D2_2]WMT39277.1 hypothetical protein RE628_17650 [Paenibacillus sp. D2_2]
MSVRINQSHTDSPKSHKELSDIGNRTHEEIDHALAELEVARGSELSLGERIDRIETTSNENKASVDDHEQRISDLETQVETNKNHVELAERDITDIAKDMTNVRHNQDDHEKRLSLAETEIKDARGAEKSIADRFHTLEGYIEEVAKQPITDLSVTNPLYQSTSNSVKVTIQAGRASINKVIVDKFTQSFDVPNIAPNTSYYIFLHEDGSYSYSVDPKEPKDAIIIGGIDIGLSPTTSLTPLDLRYFLTKGSLENDLGDLEQRVTDLETEVEDHTTAITDHEAVIDDLGKTLSAVEAEIKSSRKDKNGVVYDALQDRLDNMQSRLELAESRGTMEHQSVFHFTSPTDVRLKPQRDFTIPKYVIGSNSAEVFLDGIRMDVGDDYIEYNDTVIRFTFDVPKEARVTVIGRGSIINTTSISDYTYYPDGKVRTETITGGINRTVEYFYDATGNVERQEIIESNGQSKSIEYQRDATGRLLREINNGAMYYVLQGGILTMIRTLGEG